jgi:PleD family two-component response regulator
MSRLVIAVVDDLFFASKIRTVAETVGVEISFPRSTEALVRQAREAKPKIIIVDLHNQKLDPVALAAELKSDNELRAIPLLGFFSHVQTELQRNAITAGFDQVIPRSAFARDLAKLLATDYTDFLSNRGG